MRKDTSFSDRKLSAAEFADKYWDGGEHPYQYHTASIENGRDEKEQFLFSNSRALWETIWEIRKEIYQHVSDNWDELGRKDKRIAALAVTSAAISVIALVMGFFR